MVILEVSLLVADHVYVAKSAEIKLDALFLEDLLTVAVIMNDFPDQRAIVVLFPGFHDHEVFVVSEILDS